VEKRQLEGKATRARESCEECTCKGDLTTLELGFLQDIVMVDKPRICISST
jgi:hypothetical protein